MTRTTATAWIMSQEEVRTGDIVESTDVSKKTVHRILDDLQEEGWISKVERGLYEVHEERQDDEEKYWEENSSVDADSSVQQLVDHDVTSLDYTSDYGKVPTEFERSQAEEAKEVFEDLICRDDIDGYGIYKSRKDRIYLDENLEEDNRDLDSVDGWAHCISHEIGHSVDYGGWKESGDMRHLNLMSEIMLYKDNKYARNKEIESEMKELSARVRGNYKIDVITGTKTVEREITDEKILEEMGYDEPTTMDVVQSNGEAAEVKWKEYRRDVKELFADFVAAMINNPRWTVEIAPKSVDMFVELANDDYEGDTLRSPSQARRAQRVLEISEIEKYI